VRTPAPRASRSERQRPPAVLSPPNPSLEKLRRRHHPAVRARGPRTPGGMTAARLRPAWLKVRAAPARGRRPRRRWRLPCMLTAERGPGGRAQARPPTPPQAPLGRAIAEAGQAMTGALAADRRVTAPQKLAIRGATQRRGKALPRLWRSWRHDSARPSSRGRRQSSARQRPKQQLRRSAASETRPLAVLSPQSSRRWSWRHRSAPSRQQSAPRR